MDELFGFLRATAPPPEKVAQVTASAAAATAARDSADDEASPNEHTRAGDGGKDELLVNPAAPVATKRSVFRRGGQKLEALGDGDVNTHTVAATQGDRSEVEKGLDRFMDVWKQPQRLSQTHSLAVWSADDRADVLHARGKPWASTGEVKKKRRFMGSGAPIITLVAEEALHLAEKGDLALLSPPAKSDDDAVARVLPMKRAYELVQDADVCRERAQLYGHLRSVGLVPRRFRAASTKQRKENEEEKGSAEAAAVVDATVKTATPPTTALPSKPSRGWWRAWDGSTTIPAPCEAVWREKLLEREGAACAIVPFPQSDPSANAESNGKDADSSRCTLDDPLSPAYRVWRHDGFIKKSALGAPYMDVVLATGAGQGQPVGAAPYFPKALAAAETKLGVSFVERADVLVYVAKGPNVVP